MNSRTFIAILSATLLLCATLAASDDLAAFKAALNALCEANKQGEPETYSAFGKACAAKNNGQGITSLDNVDSEFGEISTADGNVQSWFVPAVSDIHFAVLQENLF